MKKISILTALMILSLSCGSETGTLESVIATKDAAQIRAKRDQVSKELLAAEAKMKQLDSAIAALDGSAKLPLVSTLQVKSQKFDHFLELQGDVMTDQNVLVYPEISGTLYRVHAKEGQKVGKGQLLASIDDGGLSNQLAQMKTQLDLAKTTFERQERLWKENIGSEIQFLQAKSQYEAQESAVKQMERQVGKSSIRAPFSGILDEVIKDQGTVVSPGPGSEVFRIVNLSDMYVEVEVPEAHLAKVTPGKMVEVYFPVLGTAVQTKVRQTGNFINPGNRSFTIQIPVPNKNGTIKPNLTAITKINDYSNPNAILIPLSVISENAAGQQYVYLAKENGSATDVISKKTIIELGMAQGDMVEVLSGLSVGDAIIVEGARSVRDNQEVRISKNRELAKN